MQTLGPNDLEERLLDPDLLLIDLRPAATQARDGHIGGSASLPEQQFAHWVASTTGDRRQRARWTVLVCHDGSVAMRRAEELVAAGFTDVAVLDGGFCAWRAAGRAVAGLAPWHRRAS